MHFFSTPATKKLRFPALALPALMAATILAGPAHAYEPTGNDVADAFLDLLEVQEGQVKSYEAVEEDGDTVRITGIQLANEKDEDALITIGTTGLTGGELGDDGSLALEEMSLEDVKMTSKGGHFGIESLSVTDVDLPSAADIENGGGNAAPSYASMDAKGIVVDAGKEGAFSVEHVTTSLDAFEDDIPTKGTFSVSNLVIKASDLDEEGQKTMADLGYEQLTISLNGMGCWDPATEVAEFEQVAVEMKDAAALTLSLKLGGVSKELMQELSSGTGDKDKLGTMLQATSIAALDVRLDNSSLVERVLDKQAKDSGTDRAGLVSHLKAGLPLMLTILQNSEFEKSVSTAVGTFLSDPKSLTVSAQPSAPVPVMQIMGTAMMAPQALPQILGVTIEANKAE